MPDFTVSSDVDAMMRAANNAAIAALLAANSNVVVAAPSSTPGMALFTTGVNRAPEFRAIAIGDLPSVVQYTPQTRTAAEQLQARTNIGAAASVVSAFYAEMAGASTLTNDDTTRVFPHSGNSLTKTYDTLSEFDGATGKFTATSAGYYRFRIQVKPSAVGVTRWHWGICKNAGVAGGGATTNFKDMVRQYSPAPNQLTISPGECVVYLAAGDYVQLCYTVSGTVTTTSTQSAGSSEANYFWGEKL